MVYKIYELVPRVDDAATSNNVSPHVFKTKLDLAILGIEHDRAGLIFPQIRGHLAELTANDAVTVPTLESNGSFITDSWKIAEYLDEKYAAGKLFGSVEGKAFAKLLEIWGNSDLGETIRPLVGPKFYTLQDEANQEYMLRVKFGGDAEKLKAGIARLEDPAFVQSQTAAIRARLQLLESQLAYLKSTGSGPFLAGTTATHADAVVFGWFGFLERINKPAADLAWRHESLPNVSAWVEAVTAFGVSI